MDVTIAVLMMLFGLGILVNCLTVMHTLSTYLKMNSPEFKGGKPKWMVILGFLAVAIPFVVGFSYYVISRHDAKTYQIKRCYDELLGEES